MVVAFTALTAAAGGAGVIPPHWLYLPIVIAGARFGVGGAVVTALVSGFRGGAALFREQVLSSGSHPQHPATKGCPVESTGSP